MHEDEINNLKKFYIYCVVFTVIVGVLYLVKKNNIIWGLFVTGVLHLIIWGLYLMARKNKIISRVIMFGGYVFCVTITVMSYISVYKYVSLEKELTTEFNIYKIETLDFYNTKRNFLKDKSIDFNLYSEVEDISELEYFEYISLGYNIQIADTLYALQNEIQKDLMLQNGVDIASIDVYELEDVISSYEDVISNPRFDYISSVVLKAPLEANVPNFEEEFKATFNYETLKDNFYFNEVRTAASLFPMRQRVVPYTIMLLVLTVTGVFIIKANKVKKDGEQDASIA